MRIIFMLPNGTVEWDAPEMDPPLVFGVFINAIRANGFFMSENLYIRHDSMVGISIAEEGAKLPIVRKDLQ
jgi:hypothetical protein